MIPDRVTQWCLENNCADPFRDQVSGKWFAFQSGGMMPIECELKPVIVFDEARQRELVEAFQRVALATEEFAQVVLYRVERVVADLITEAQTPQLRKIDLGLRPEIFYGSAMPPRFMQESDAEMSRRHSQMRLMFLYGGVNSRTINGEELRSRLGEGVE
jgi:hypothetical protein